MAQEIPFPGFQYDQAKAEAMADAIEATLSQANAAGVTVPDRLAALAIASAVTIVRSKLDRAPEVAAGRIRDYILLYVARLQEAARRTPPPAVPG